MLGWAAIIAATVLMYRLAEMGERSGALWGVFAFVICYGSVMFIPLPMLNILIGFVITYIIFIIASIIKK